MSFINGPYIILERSRGERWSQRWHVGCAWKGRI